MKKPSINLRTSALSVRLLFAFAVAVTTSFSGAPVAGQDWDAPTGYYDSATGTGATLAAQLHDVIDDHTRFSYNAARSILQITDADPNDPDSIVLVYNNVSLDLSSLANNSIPGWDAGDSWNREHTWPRSRDVGSSGDDNSDLHQLRPSDPSINGSRSNLNFGGAFGSGQARRLDDGNGEVWYPGDLDAGHIARQQFYVDVRYDGSDSNTVDLVLANGNPASSTGNLGDLDRLIEWHYAAPVSDFERRRNDIIFDDYQGNRNPFIDRPELAWSVLQDQQNDSRVEIVGGTSDGQGGSTLDVDLGRVIAGSTVSTQQEVTLNKSGLDGTYYSVQASGGATSSIEGRYNAFRTGQTDSQTLTVGLDASTATAGVQAGSVTFDNLDVTTGGGAGRGDNDADDMINLSLTVLDHAQPSFDSSQNVASLEIDLGDFFVGSRYTPTTSIDIFNRATAAGLELTAGLDLDAIAEVDSADKFSLTENLFQQLSAGGSAAIDFTGDSSSLGEFAADFTFQLSDEDIEGAESSVLSLSLSFDVVAEVGDFDLSGAVDDQDIDFYTQRLGQAVTPELRELDLDGDGFLTTVDHNLHATTLLETATGLQGTVLGDLNLDGTVDIFLDGFALLQNLGLSGVGYAQGDLNADGSVDVLEDGFLFLANLGSGPAAGSPAPLSTSAVPEPGSLTALILLTGMHWARRRRS